MWWTEHEELQKPKITEQPGFVPPSRLCANQSERIATETKELTAARLAKFSANESNEVPNARLCSVPQKEHTFPSIYYTVELKLYGILFVQLQLSQAVSETLHS